MSNQILYIPWELQLTQYYN